MNNLSEDIKNTYIIALAVMIFFVLFIIIIVVVYNNRQINYLQQEKLKESEYQNQLLQKELEKQKSIETERERISHDMHDDLGAGISALKLHAEFLKQKVEDGELKNDIDELLKTSEEMNISMREMLWSLNSGNDTLGSFVEYAQLYAHNFLKKSNIRLTVERENIVTETAVSTELRRNMFLCLKEALNNSYKHSKADKIELLFRQHGKEFIMKITDNGIGISAGKPEGNGLRNMNRRMHEQKGECRMSSSEKGTEAIFTASL